MAKFFLDAEPVDQHAIAVLCAVCLDRGRRTKLGFVVREDPTPPPVAWALANPDREWPGATPSYVTSGASLRIAKTTLIGDCRKCGTRSMEAREDRLHELLEGIANGERRVVEVALPPDGKLRLVERATA